MKKVFSSIVTVLVTFALVAGLSLVPKTDVNAAKKQKVSEEQQHVYDLIAYRDSLIAQGNSDPEYIKYVNSVIDAEQKAIDDKAAMEAALAQQQQALKEAQALKAAQQKEVLKAMGVKNGDLAAAAKKSTKGVFMIGDSRFVDMRNVVGTNGASIVAAGWMGYDWMCDTAIPYVDPYIGKGSRVVINLGVNDMYNADKYIATVNAKAAEWAQRGARVYYATVNPSDPGASKSDYAITEFNNKLKAGLSGVGIIDTNTFLKGYGYTTTDCLHYDAMTSYNVYCYIMSQI